MLKVIDDVQHRTPGARTDRYRESNPTLPKTTPPIVIPPASQPIDSRRSASSCEEWNPPQLQSVSAKYGKIIIPAPAVTLQYPQRGTRLKSNNTSHDPAYPPSPWPNCRQLRQQPRSSKTRAGRDRRRNDTAPQPVTAGLLLSRRKA